jgi:hypothetical protein
LASTSGPPPALRITRGSPAAGIEHGAPSFTTAMNIVRFSGGPPIAAGSACGGESVFAATTSGAA